MCVDYSKDVDVDYSKEMVVIKTVAKGRGWQRRGQRGAVDKEAGKETEEMKTTERWSE